MEFPVEGNDTPNFTESECSISIPGIVWNEESPRSFRETPQITSPNKDSGDSRLKAFNAQIKAFNVQRIGDTPRPAEEVPSVESIIERVCSQMCNDLRRSGALRDEVVDTVHAQVYSQLSSRCIRRSADPDVSAPASPVGGRSSSNNESRVRQNSGGKSSNGDRDSVLSRASTGRSVVKSAKSLNARDEESRRSSRNSRMRISANSESRIAQNHGRRSADGDRDSVESRAATERSGVKSAKSLNTRNEETSQESRNSSKSSRVRSSLTTSSRSEIVTTSRAASSVSGDMTRSGTPEYGQLSTSANRVSSRGSLIGQYSERGSIGSSVDRPSPSFRQTSSPVIQSIQSTTRSTCTNSRSSGRVQDCPSDKTELLCPSKLPQSDQSSTLIGREPAFSRSSVSCIPVRTKTPGVMEPDQITRNEDNSIQASSSEMYRTSSPTSHGSGHSSNNTDRCKSVDTETNRDDKEMCYSPQMSSTVLSVGLHAPVSKENAHNERRIDETKDESSKPASEKSSSLKPPMSRSSKIPIRSATPKDTEPAKAKAKDNAKRISNEMCKDSDTNVEESAKSVSRRENNASNGTVNKAKMKGVLKAGSKKEENNQMNALERRKAYEAKRKLERKVALAAKTVERTEIASKQQKRKTQEIDELKNKASRYPIVKTEVSITEKNPCHNEDNFTYEDDFEPMDEEERNEHHKSAADTGDDNTTAALAPVSQIEMESAYHDVNPASSVKDDYTEGKPNNIPRLNFMTDKEIHDWHLDMAFGRVAAESGRANPGSTRSDVDFGYLGHPATFNVPVQSQSGYNPEYCLVHMHPSIAHVYDNLDLIPGYKTMKEPTRRKAGKRSTNADGNEHIRRKPPNAKKKTTVVGYVPGYGAVRVMKEDSSQACPGERKHNSNSTSFRVIGNQPNPGRTQRPVVGYVPGYGPVRGPPVKAFPEVPSERVVLPPLNINQTHGCHGDVERSKKGRDKKRGTDLLEARARAKPFNTYVDEEASRRFERQYTRHR